MRLNRQFEQIVQSPTVAATDRILALKAAGRPIIALNAGDPDFTTPPEIIAAGVRALQAGWTHYVPSRGLPELRAAIAAQLAQLVDGSNGQKPPYDPQHEILVSHGGIHAYYLAMQSILNPGDEVLIPDPSWGTHANLVRQLRGTVRLVPALPEDGFLPRLTAWENALTPQTCAIVINYPANPTGAIPARAYLRDLLAFAQSHDLWVVSDEVYQNLYFEQKPLSVAAFPEFRERVVLLNSLSKTYAMTGWRVGYLAAPQALVDNALRASQNSITCVAPFVQQAAAFALSDPAMQIAAAGMHAAYARRRQLVLDIYNQYPVTPLKLTPPQGAFYFFLDLRALGLSSTEICERILDEAGVGLVPGTAFGRQGEGFVRMTIAASDADIAAGFRAILDWAQKAGRA
ncbi:MAG: aminotransferase class I/II-fold pyridoxal phosphate-dependent enzyme [Anaerolineae bacterium]|nr:aminotransferase class I/II-fold pyridoxal phosphate-dependent enzyme [Anaerolineae bacterium]